MKSVMQNRLARNPQANISRSSFNRSHGHKTTFNASKLIPIYVDECLPGDTFKLKGTHFARLATPLFPIMDNMYFETFYFEVPVRQIWDNWKKFNGEQESPGDSTDYLIPTVTSPAGGYDIGSLQDYMGIPTGVQDLEHSVLPIRAYKHIWNTWFRDQNLQGPIDLQKGDGPDLPFYHVVARGKRHDYFTSALPWPQKSDSVELPIGDQAPVLGIGIQEDDGYLTQQNVRESDLQTKTYPGWTITDTTTDLGSARMSFKADETHQYPDIYADLSEATAVTINQLRQSIAVQRLFEKDARGGTRYIEVIKNHFGVTSPDLRLQRPGYLGGGSTPINITPVAQTTQTLSSDPDHPKGSMAAFGTVGASNHGFTRSFTEHTIVIGLACVRADLTYQQGLDRMWSRQTRFDHYWPELATIGEQEVLQKEIFASGIPTEDETVFGYQERYAEYRYKASKITGHMRSSSPESLDAWHLSQEFENAPVLSNEFIREEVPLDRVIATPGQPHFIMDSYFQLNCVRPMPMFGIPGLDKL